MGVEEEFLLVDTETGRPAPRIDHVIDRADELAGDQAQEELHRAQIELATAPWHTMDDVRTELLVLRKKLVAAAAHHGCTVVASATYPGTMGIPGRLITGKDRYRDMERANPMLAPEQLICGCHIHVSAPDPSDAIRTMNTVRRWLAVLLALSANSPFWEGTDTGFASYRTEIWIRWPTAGPIGQFSSMAEYDAMVESLIRAGVVLDAGMAYWDIRPSKRFPTLEIRIADVMADVQTVVTVAALARALVEACRRSDAPVPVLRPELLRAASWRAAEAGLSDTLIDPLNGTARTARETLDDLLAFTGPELAARGELDQVASTVDALCEAGTGSTVQRAAYARRQQLSDVLKVCSLGEDGRPVAQSL